MKLGLRTVFPAALISLLALTGRPATGTLADSGSSPLSQINHIVVIYQENHSFDNLYGGWERVNGLATAPSARTSQLNQAGIPYNCLLQNDPQLTSPPLPADCTDTTNPSKPFSSHFTNAPFTIDSYFPSSAATRDLVHRFYQEQYEVNDGQQNRYVTGSDAVGLTMGVYNTRALPIYQYLHQDNHPAYAIADNFFQAAFGGSFLNHQWLVAAATPVFPGAPNDGSSADLHSVVDANGMSANYPLYSSPLGSAVLDRALTASCEPPAGRPATPENVACGDYAVNTIQPTFQPYYPGTPASRQLPPLTTPNIGDRLSARGVDWAWYSGGWSNAAGNVGEPGWSNGAGPTCTDPNALPTATYPNCPDKLFQFHHQAFNYFASYGPGTAARAQHLRDEEEFKALAKSSTTACGLKPVSFVKPIGEENEHPGYATEQAGSQHLVDLIAAVENSACRRDTLIVTTYDEFGGAWDHVPPPGQGGVSGAHDEWGPGTRIPALLISPNLQSDFVVDRTQHDTTSILATIEHRFGVAPLGPRDSATRDLSSIYSAD